MRSEFSRTNDEILKLKKWFSQKKKVVVAFSGGVDSSLLAKLACDAVGANAYAITGVSETFSGDERVSAGQIAGWIGINRDEIYTQEMADETFTRNDVNRCYVCKRELFKKCLLWAKSHDVDCVVEGTNIDDLQGHRPGYKAGQKMGVYAPFVELSIGKQSIRRMAKSLSLPNWDKPALACLSSRFPAGTKITSENLTRIEKCEKIIKSLGFVQFRVRFHGNLVRWEVAEDEMPKALENGYRTEIRDKLKSLGFEYVGLDLNPFRGEKFLKNC